MPIPGRSSITGTRVACLQLHSSGELRPHRGAPNASGRQMENGHMKDDNKTKLFPGQKMDVDLGSETVHPHR